MESLLDVQAIERFILDNLLQGKRRKSIGLDEPLISSGVMDSLWMLRLIAFIEESLDITIGEGEVTPENFETMRKIMEFVERKRAS